MTRASHSRQSTPLRPRPSRPQPHLRSVITALRPYLHPCSQHARARLAAAILCMLVLACASVVWTPAPAHAASSTDPDLYNWSEKRAPNYLVQWGKSKGSSKAPKAGKVVYSKLDKRGRTRTAMATVTYKMVEKAAKRKKKSIPYANKPSGWGYNKTVKYKLSDGSTYKGYLYNRSHLIADSLGGSVKTRNLITGTRTQNVGANDDTGGMAFCECLVRSWLYRNKDGSVYYRVRPVYQDAELVPRSLVVDMKSSDGTLNKRFVVYNAIRSYDIDYASGKAKKIKPAPAVPTYKLPAKTGKVYSTATGARYHRHKLCDALAFAITVKKTTRKKAETAGLEPCSICWPDSQ